jgi:hypothetical protein
MGRRTVDLQAALTLEAALRGTSPDGQFRGKTVGSEGGDDGDPCLTWCLVRHQGLGPRTR